ncbi:MAG: ribosome biogenesis GTP-binding protein YihA/YsxC [Bacteroidales bacterium]
MIIRSASFITSSPKASQCPTPDKPEFAFIGRSNVGKSSLINMITGFGKLAKTSSTPGKTQTINHFLINEQWYLVDLPGYGFAKVAHRTRDHWVRETWNYVQSRENLVCLFVLIDSRIPPQEADMEFMMKAGMKGVPIARVFTKADRKGSVTVGRNMRDNDKKMLQDWAELPPTFITSAVNKTGRDEILNFIEQSINNSQIG